jgi:hypothetical protein
MQAQISTNLHRWAFEAISKDFRSLRLAAQDVALSRRKQGFESPRERHKINNLGHKGKNECPNSVPVTVQGCEGQQEEAAWIAGLIPARSVYEATGGQPGTNCRRAQ